VGSSCSSLRWHDPRHPLERERKMIGRRAARISVCPTPRQRRARRRGDDTGRAMLEDLAHQRHHRQRPMDLQTPAAVTETASISAGRSSSMWSRGRPATDAPKKRQRRPARARHRRCHGSDLRPRSAWLITPPSDSGWCGREATEADAATRMQKPVGSSPGLPRVRC